MASNGSFILHGQALVGVVGPHCDLIRFAGHPPAAPKGWCRRGTPGCIGPPPPPPPGPAPVDRVTFKVDPTTTPRRLHPGFWDSESWQPSNYPSSRFLLAPDDPLLAVFPFASDDRSSGLAAGPESWRRAGGRPGGLAAAPVRGPQVAAGFTNIVRGLGGWGTSSWCGPKNGVAWNPQQTSPCAAYDLAHRAANGTLMCAPSNPDTNQSANSCRVAADCCCVVGWLD